MGETSVGVVKRYLEDAIAAEKGFEAQYESFAKEADEASLQELFRQQAAATKAQHDRLVEQLSNFGGTPSTTKGLLAQLFGLSPKIAQIGQNDTERTSQNLYIAFGIENSKLALYEALSTVAEAAGEDDVAALTRSLQSQQKDSIERIWKILPGTEGEEALAALSNGAHGKPAAV